uniref:Uncharacterized protein n=1 Tax=Anguilla anguilla TaxID=7936 RepID=A0A0E9XGR1_ANGAN
MILSLIFNECHVFSHVCARLITSGLYSSKYCDYFLQTLVSNIPLTSFPVHAVVGSTKFP